MNNNIKLIALDLDGTTLRTGSILSAQTKEALEAAIMRGIEVVIATGRTFSALPQEILDINGLKYVITSNGANLIELSTGSILYSNYIEEKRIVEIGGILGKHRFMVEVFSEGKAYIDREIYDNLDKWKVGEEHKKYVLATRRTTENIFDFLKENKNEIENINIIFGNQKDKDMMHAILESINDITLTSSREYNIEIGGSTTSKADALNKLCQILGIRFEQVMACGDSPNDEAMLRVAGLPIAMGNAVKQIKIMAKYITGSNDEDGVAEAINKFVL